MNWLIENWPLLVAGVSVIGCIAMFINNFLKKPTDEQIENVQEWLLYAVTEAEAQLGGGTGQLKLRFVYDMAVSKFSWVSLVPFDTFSMWVDEALETMRKMLARNDNVKALVEGINPSIGD